MGWEGFMSESCVGKVEGGNALVRLEGVGGSLVLEILNYLT